MKMASSPSRVMASVTLSSNPQGQQGEICIVIHPSWVICLPQQGIRPTHLPPRLVGQDEVKPGEVQGPSCLAAVQFVGLLEIRQVLMIHMDLELLIGSLEEVPPLCHKPRRVCHMSHMSHFCDRF